MHKAENKIPAPGLTITLHSTQTKCMCWQSPQLRRPCISFWHLHHTRTCTSLPCPGTCYTRHGRTCCHCIAPGLARQAHLHSHTQQQRLLYFCAPNTRLLGYLFSRTQCLKIGAGKQPFCHTRVAEKVVRQWSDNGQTMVRQWSDSGQTMPVATFQDNLGCMFSPVFPDWIVQPQPHSG